MINKISNISLKFIKANKSIALSCITAIAISIFLITSLMNFAINSEMNLKNETKEVFGDFEYQIGYDSNSVTIIDDEFVSKVKDVNGVEKISKALIDNLNINGVYVYSVGVENDELSKSKYKYLDDIKENNIVINTVLAESLKLNVGDKINIEDSVKIVQDIFNDETNASSPIEMLIMNREELKDLLILTKEADFIMIKADDSVSQLSNSLKSIDSELRVEAFEENEFVAQNVNTLKYFVIFLALLVFIICGIFIISNLQQYIYKYVEQFAIIKAIGGSSRQVFNILTIQTLIMNVSGVLIGILATFISVKVFINSFKFYIVPIFFTALLGFIIIQILLLIPGIKTSKVLPIKVMQDNEISKGSNPKILRILSYMLIIIGVVIFVYYIFFNDDVISLVQSVSSFILIASGTYALFRVNLSNILRFLEIIFKFLFGTVGSIAIKTLQTQIRKSSLIIFAVATAMIITFIGGNFTEALIRNNEEYYRNEYLTDLVVSSNSEMNFNESQELYETINSLEDVYSSMIIEGSVTSYDGNNIDYSLGDLEGLKKQGLVQQFNGSEKNNVVISKDFAERNNISINDEIILSTARFNEDNSMNIVNEIERLEYKSSMKVVDICEYNITNYSDLLIDFSNREFIDSELSTLSKIYISTQRNDINEVIKEIKILFPSIKYATLNDVLDESNKAINKRWEYFKSALILIIVTTVFGAINSLKNNFNSRRKEYAVLRCMKFTVNTLRKMLLLQITVFLLLGQILGVFLGFLGSVILTSIDAINFNNTNLNMILFNIILTLVITGMCLVPYILRVSQEKVSTELGQEE